MYTGPGKLAADDPRRSWYASSVIGGRWSDSDAHLTRDRAGSKQRRRQRVRSARERFWQRFRVRVDLQGHAVRIIRLKGKARVGARDTLQDHQAVMRA